MEQPDQQNYIDQVPDHFLSGEKFAIVHTNRPGLLRTLPVPGDLSLYYPSAGYASHEEGGGGFMGRIYRLARRFQLSLKLSWIKPYHPTAGRVLDIGAGTGEWLSFLKSRGWRVDGSEPAGPARVLARGKGLDLIPDFMEIKGEGYDLITLWHVLEHIPDLESTLEKLSELSVKGGTIAIGVPNYRSWDAGYYGRDWAAWDVPRHLWHFDKSALVSFMGDYGFGLVKSRAMWMDAFYVSLLSERYARDRASLFGGMLSGLRSTMYSALYGEPSSRAYIFRKSI